MPRKVVPPTIAAPIQPPPLSPTIQQLRRNWKWAGISQFIYTFSDAFGLLDWDIEALEKDLDGAEQSVIPELLVKLLYALTWNHQINRGNVFDHLVRQYLQREPENRVLGSEEEPIAWQSLDLGQKVQIIWQLCEWQLDDPSRFRSLLSSESDAASWRVDPIGWDKAGNTYYLFDDNRLWIQRAFPRRPRPPKKSTVKAKKSQRVVKRAPPPKTSLENPEHVHRAGTLPMLSKVAEAGQVSGRRKRKQVEFYGNVTPTLDALKDVSRSQITSPSRATRSSARADVHSASKATASAPLPRGTRISRRLHAVDDEWQQVPDEWLAFAPQGGLSTQVMGDDESELSDLPDEDPHPLQDVGAEASMADVAKDSETSSSDSALSDVPSRDVSDAASDVSTTKATETLSSSAQDKENAGTAAEGKEGGDIVDESGCEGGEEDGLESMTREDIHAPEGFVEWEAVCVTLYDWKTFPEQFARSRHPDEKAFYKLLSSEVAPQILEALEVKEQERLKQEAINNRKRSSRIALRELEREEHQKREQAEREMEERMEKSRQEEIRRRREEEEIMSRERARESRLREREERLAARERAIHERAESEARQRELAERARERRKRRREGEEVSDDELASAGPSRAETAAPSETHGSWELRCEICQLHGWNLNDETDVVCCDDCGRWQHMPCHDRRDRERGRAPRDWDSVDFRCQECEARISAAKRPKAESRPPQGDQPRSAVLRQTTEIKPFLHNGQTRDGPLNTSITSASSPLSHGSHLVVDAQSMNGPLQHQQPAQGHIAVVPLGYSLPGAIQGDQPQPYAAPTGQQDDFPSSYGTLPAPPALFAPNVVNGLEHSERAQHPSGADSGRLECSSELGMEERTQS